MVDHQEQAKHFDKSPKMEHKYQCHLFLCGEEIKSKNHKFFSCLFSKKVWDILLQLTGQWRIKEISTRCETVTLLSLLIQDNLLA